MADYGVYWKFHRQDASDTGVRLLRWYIGAGSRLTGVQPRDRLWFITSGKACHQPGEGLGYLAAFLTVDRIIPTNGEARYSGKELPLVIIGDPGRCTALEPPLLVDRLVRPEGAAPNRPIGTFRQSPWKLSTACVDDLHAIVRRFGGKAPARALES